MLESVAKHCSQITIEHKRLIVSIGAGRAETEMNSNDLCICLDKDKNHCILVPLLGSIS
jgi:hypothetical protein